MDEKKVKEGAEESLKEKLIGNLNYTDQQAEMVMEDLKKLDSDLVPILEEWKVKGSVKESGIYHGYTVKKLMELYQMEVIGALLTLDWIIKEPEKAISALPDPKPF